MVVAPEAGGKAIVVNVGNSAETQLDRGFDGDAGFSMSPDGQLLAGSAGGVLRVWSTKSGQVVHEEAP